jgi:hypothetical protein
LAALANTKGGYLVIGAGYDGLTIGLTREEAFYARDRIRQIGVALMPGRLREVTVILVGGRNLVLADITAPDKDTPPIITTSGQVWERVLQPSGIDTVRNDTVLAGYIGSKIENIPTIYKKEWVVFVAMSFHTEREPSLIDYYKAMERAARRSAIHIDLRKMDEVEGDYEISQALMKEIDKSDAVLADFTLSPHNVYYEVGYARGKGKTLIQTARKGTRLEFDVRNWRTLTYRNATELEEFLVKAFDALGSGRPA